MVCIRQDLSVKTEGVFVLRYRCFDILSLPSPNQRPVLAECFGGLFRVYVYATIGSAYPPLNLPLIYRYSTKECPRLPPSTDLSKVSMRIPGVHRSHQRPEDGYYSSICLG